MVTTLTIQDLKRQLNIEPEFAGDDALLQRLLNTAVQAISRYMPTGTTATTVTTSGTTVTTTMYDLEQVIILLAAHYYQNRNMVSFGSGQEIPYTFQFLLNHFIDYPIS